MNAYSYPRPDPVLEARVAALELQVRCLHLFGTAPPPALPRQRPGLEAALASLGRAIESENTQRTAR